MKSKKLLILLTVAFAILTAIISPFNGDFAIVPLFLSGICFIGFIIAVVVGAAKENNPAK